MDVQFIIDRTKKLKQDVAQEQEANELLTATHSRLKAVADGREGCMLHLRQRLVLEQNEEALLTHRLHNVQIEEERAEAEQHQSSIHADRHLRQKLREAAHAALFEALSKRWQGAVRAHFEGAPEIAQAEELRRRVREAEGEGPMLVELKETEEHVMLENLGLQKAISDKEQKIHELDLALKACKSRTGALLSTGEKEVCRLEAEAQEAEKTYDNAYAEVGMLQQIVYEAHGRLTQKEKERQRLRQLMRTT